MTRRDLPDRVVRNGDVEWDQWPVQRYLAENYRDLHPCDAAIIDHHCAFYRRLAPDSIDRALELGAGPNLYPLLLAAACSRRIDALEPSAASVAYVRTQLAQVDASWQPFYDRCRARNAQLPGSMSQALARVRVIAADASAVTPGSYGMASMSFVAESVTESREEFRAICRSFISSVRPGGYLVAAFMENLGRYRLADRQWPAVPVGVDDVRAAFGSDTGDLSVSRIDADPTLPDYGYTGMVLLTARRGAAGG